MPHVAILLHRDGSLNDNNYWIRPLAECWRDRGIRVSVTNDPHDPADADLAILHVDLTVVPDEYLSWAGRFPRAINGTVADISKRAISNNLVRPGDPYGGPVIVKTNRNCAGYPERFLARKGRRFGDPGTPAARSIDYLTERVQKARRFGLARTLDDYPVFDSPAEVPGAVWRDDEWIVERFLPERIDGRYCVRTWLFFGDRERHAIFYSHDPIVKSRNIIGYDPLLEVPEELRERRRALKFDFGKFDYTMVDGRPVLFDANRTPSIGNFPRERYLPLAESFADGIGAFLGNHSAIERSKE